MNKLLLRQFLPSALLVFSFCLNTFAQQRALLLPAETPLSLELTETLNSDSLISGTEIELVVSGNLKIDDDIVIIKGTKAKARIIKTESELNTFSRVYIEPYECSAADGQAITLGGPAHVLEAPEPDMSIIIKEGTEIGAEIYTNYTILLGEIVEESGDKIPAIVDEPQILPVGLEISLLVNDEVVYSELEEGSPVMLRVKTDVILGTEVVISAKLPATGFVKHLVDNKLYISANSITLANGTQIAVDCDRSTVITLDAENEDDIQPISGELKVFVAHKTQR